VKGAEVFIKFGEYGVFLNSGVQVGVQKLFSNSKRELRLSPRSNDPSWPCIETMPYLEAKYTCAVGTGAKAKGLAMRKSPYTVSQRPRNKGGFSDDVVWFLCCPDALYGPWKFS
jgi:hypothetical protein